MVGSTNTMISKKGKFLVPKTHDLYDWKEVSAMNMSFNTSRSVAVVLNNEIHVLGGNGSPVNTSAYQHWKWDGTTWVHVGNLPYYFSGGQAVVYNNEIHILGSSADESDTLHYKYNGTQWVSVSTLPYGLKEGQAVVYNGAIHIMGAGEGSTSPHYKWNGTTWTRVGTFPYEFSEGCLIIHEGKMHAIGTRSSALRKNHYVFDDTTSAWVKDSNQLPVSFFGGEAFSIDDEIHLVGGSNNCYHKKYDGSNWIKASDMPIDFSYAPAVIYQGAIYILGGNNSKKVYAWNVPNNKKSFNFLLPYGAKVTGTNIWMEDFSLIQVDANPASTFSHVKTTSPLDISFTADNSKPLKITLGNDILYTNGVN